MNETTQSLGDGVGGVEIQCTSSSSSSNRCCRPRRRLTSLATAAALVSSSAACCSAFSRGTQQSSFTSCGGQSYNSGSSIPLPLHHRLHHGRTPLQPDRLLVPALNMVSFLEAPTTSSSLSTHKKGSGGRRGSSSSRTKKDVTIEIELPELEAFDFDSFVETSSSSASSKRSRKSSTTKRMTSFGSSMPSTRTKDTTVVVSEKKANVVPEIDSEILYEGIMSAAVAQRASLAPSMNAASSVDENKPKPPTAASKQVVPNKKDTTTKSTSKSSTMPGFIKAEGLDDHIATKGMRIINSRRTVSRIVRSKSQKLKRRQTNSEAMYKKSAAVPDSLVDYAHEIHAVSRVSPKEEKELGAKTQEAMRLQKMYEDLQSKHGREPTDDEWCAAAGKINMEALEQVLEEGIEAKNQLVASNLRMVQRVVNLYIRNGLGSEYNAGDLMQDGTMVSMYVLLGYGWHFLGTSTILSHIHLLLSP